MVNKLVKCDYCPVKCGDCWVQKTGQRPVCNKVNPASSEYNPKQVEMLVSVSCGGEYKNETSVTAKPFEEKSSEPVYPSLMQQAKNLGGSLINFAKSGFQKADDETYNRRLRICEGCEFLDKEHKRCLKCGCFVKAKAAMGSESCPIGKWNMSDEDLSKIEEEKRTNYERFVQSVIVHPCSSC